MDAFGTIASTAAEPAKAGPATTANWWDNEPDPPDPIERAALVCRFLNAGDHSARKPGITYQEADAA